MHLHNFPLNGMNRFGASLDEDDVGWVKNLQIKVHIDLTKPIVRDRTITIKGVKY